MIQNQTTFFSASNAYFLSEPRRSGCLWDDKNNVQDNDYICEIDPNTNTAVCRPLSPDDRRENARQLAQALEQYKLLHRRRFLTFEEIIAVLESLGYKKQNHFSEY
ncbi:MAG: hypothetical protein Q4C95_06375 [Planctomycetia bacterium]|nr:hypothetical protein [Planctomycetia bacterium]